MTDDVLKRFEGIRIFAKGGKLAPHKPLLLLYALSKLKNEKAERIAFTDAEDVVGPLIQTYGPFNAKTSVVYPYTRLANDHIWWVEPHEKNASGDLNLTEARDRKLQAGFSEDVRFRPAEASDVRWQRKGRDTRLSQPARTPERHEAFHFRGV